jgi:hypothetical protein
MVVESPYHASKAFEAFHTRWNFSKPYPFSTKVAKAA